jgi:hypothetical protein
MGAFVLPVQHPVIDGLVVTRIRQELLLQGWQDGLTVQRELPEVHTRRMATVRNDGGPAEGSRLRQRYGVNVWADYSLDAEKMARAAMAGCRTLAGVGPIAATDEFSGVFEIDDEESFIVGTKALSHYFFSFRATVRGTNKTPELTVS